MEDNSVYDVVIIGAGLAGLSLARQLLMNSSKRILHLEKRSRVPINKQKVGESNVAVSGYYFSKMLDLEAHLHKEHLMKYNLRFLWKTAGCENDDYLDYSQCFTRDYPNIPTFNLDRNRFESELIDRNRAFANYELVEGIRKLDIRIEEGGPHLVDFERKGSLHRVEAVWVIDTSGRVRHLARKHNLIRESENRHSAAFFWVDGNLDVARMSKSSPNGAEMIESRRVLGHTPAWLSTNQFMGEGYWLWVIPLPDRTSFGLIYDGRFVNSKQVSTEEGMLEWLFETFPLFKNALQNREIIDYSYLKNFSHDCTRTIHRDKWAMSGFSGRFNDPLYNSGMDAIAIHNTLIVDAILTQDETELEDKVERYETVFRRINDCFTPSQHPSYEVLGDQEAFTLKYAWDQSCYHVFYVYPFINHLFEDKTFLDSYLKLLAEVDALDQWLQKYIFDFYNWKKRHRNPPGKRVYFDFSQISALQSAEAIVFEVGVEGRQAYEVLEKWVEDLKELALFAAAYIDAEVAGNPNLITNHSFVERIEMGRQAFDPDNLQQLRVLGNGEYPWRFDTSVLCGIFGPEIETKAVVAEFTKDKRAATL